jgi:hypothetical protein
MPEWLQSVIGPSAVMILVGVTLLLFELRIGKRKKGSNATNNIPTNH